MVEDESSRRFERRLLREKEEVGERSAKCDGVQREKGPIRYRNGRGKKGRGAIEGKKRNAATPCVLHARISISGTSLTKSKMNHHFVPFFLFHLPFSFTCNRFFHLSDVDERNNGGNARGWYVYLVFHTFSPISSFPFPSSFRRLRWVPFRFFRSRFPLRKFRKFEPRGKAGVVSIVHARDLVAVGCVSSLTPAPSFPSFPYLFDPPMNLLLGTQAKAPATAAATPAPAAATAAPAAATAGAAAAPAAASTSTTAAAKTPTPPATTAPAAANGWFFSVHSFSRVSFFCTPFFLCPVCFASLTNRRCSARGDHHGGHRGGQARSCSGFACRCHCCRPRRHCCTRPCRCSARCRWRSCSCCRR